MKTKWTLPVMLIMAVAISACQKDQSGSDINPVIGKLKQILLYQSINSDTPIGIVEEYEYNEEGKITKTSSPMYNNGIVVGTISYDLYEYNAFGQLARIRNYNSDLSSPSGYINLYNKTFTYFADGKTATKTIEYQSGVTSELSLYDYKNDQLVKVSMFENGNMDSYTVNEYDGSGKLIKESLYAADGQCISYTLHNYSGSLLIRSDLYTFQTNSLYRTINRTYDANGNLIMLESKELFAYSDMMSFVYKYKYYE